MDYRKVYKRVEKRYMIVVIILILLLTSRQIIIQFEINHGKDMSRTINMAGRQRMLSQKVTKDILMMYENNKEERNYYINDLESSLDIMEKSHFDLIYGNKDEGLRGSNSDIIIKRFKEIDPYLNSILESGRSILNLIEESNYDQDLFSEEIRIINENESLFLQKMDQIVDQYDEEFQSTILLIERTEVILFLLILFVLLILTLFIFRPAIRTLRQAFIDIGESNESINKLFYGMKGALFLVEGNGNIMTMNSDAHRILKLDKIKDKKSNIIVDFNWIDLDLGPIIDRAILGEKFDGIEVELEDKKGNILSMLIAAISGKYNRQDVVLISAFDITSQKKAEAILKDMAMKDELTGLYNRYFLESIIDSEIERSRRYEFPLSAAILDIDDFKKINDKWGHPVGDIILKEIADILKENLRESDYLIRVGGEEFVIIMSHTDLDGAYIVTDKLRKAIEKSRHPIVGQFTVSFGVAEIEGREEYCDLYERMDRALYKAKESGKNQVVRSISEDDIPWDKLLLWKDSWNSGEEQIDLQHKELLKIAGKIVESSHNLDSKDNLLYNFNLILHLVKEHFDYEEGILENLKYSNLKEHKSIHRDLLEKASLLKDRAVNGNIVFQDVLEFMFHDLILGHLVKDDVKFFPIIREKNIKSIIK